MCKECESGEVEDVYRTLATQMCSMEESQRAITSDSTRKAIMANWQLSYCPLHVEIVNFYL